MEINRKNLSIIIKGSVFLFFSIMLFVVATATGKVSAETISQNLSVHILTTGSEDDYAKIKEQSFVSDGNSLIPFTLSQSGNLYMKVFSDKPSAEPIHFYKTADASDLPTSFSCPCTEGSSYSYMGISNGYLEKGTYYMQLPEGNFQVKACLYPSTSRTLKLDQWTSAFSDYNHITYFTYKPESNGYLTLYEETLIGTHSSAGITLCNSKGKSLVNNMTYDNDKDKIVYALKKGTTYKIKVYATEPNRVQFYRLKAKFTKRTEKSGSSQKKAVSVSFGKTAKGMVFAEDSISKGDWYKVTNPKKQEVKITYGGSITSGSMLLGIYRASGKKFASYAVVSHVGESTEYVITDKNGIVTLPKGTYYFKITKSRKEASGVYFFKMSAL